MATAGLVLWLGQKLGPPDDCSDHFPTIIMLFYFLGFLTLGEVDVRGFVYIRTYEVGTAVENSRVYILRTLVGDDVTGWRRSTPGHTICINDALGYHWLGKVSVSASPAKSKLVQPRHGHDHPFFSVVSLAALVQLGLDAADHFLQPVFSTRLLFRNGLSISATGALSDYSDYEQPTAGLEPLWRVRFWRHCPLAAKQARDHIRILLNPSNKQRTSPPFDPPIITAWLLTGPLL
ncbi:hypothetical protein ACRALDRAFT_207909 [Sodiomyces alcalophilus JCM 7366]|uniref:uncharacterized protein n=1 Tax=Sodiomyces alcalophilus JCM 7366 TaxID=591952 RepID=UPI0039B5D622